MNKLLWLIGGFALALILLLWVLWPASQNQGGDAAVRHLSPEPREIVLYFVDAGGFSLVSEEHQIAGCNDERQCIAQTLEALSAGSKQHQPVLPDRTRILGVEVEGDLVRINFSRDLVDRHPGGSLSELLTVYGVANTLAVNFPDLRLMQILIEGKVENTLKGHVDISRPIKAEFRYSRAPEVREENPVVPAQANDGTVSGVKSE